MKRLKPHWISRFLTRDWELNEKRELAYYDVVSRRLARPVTSARLFREKRGRDEDLERRLNELIETPISQARDLLLAPKPVDVLTWKLHRAFILLLEVQGLRVMARDARDDSQLATILRLPDEYVDHFAARFVNGRELLRLGSSDPHHSMFYPQNGMFGFMTQDTGCVTGWGWGFAVPITPAVAFALVSATADCAWLFDACTRTPHLQAYSILKEERLVVPPVLVPHTRDSPGWLADHQGTLVRYVQDHQERRASYLRALKKAGALIEVENDGSQRYRVTNGVTLPLPDA